MSRGRKPVLPPNTRVRSLRLTEEEFRQVVAFVQSLRNQALIGVNNAINSRTRTTDSRDSSTSPNTSFFPKNESSADTTSTTDATNTTDNTKHHKSTEQSTPTTNTNRSDFPVVVSS